MCLPVVFHTLCIGLWKVLLSIAMCNGIYVACVCLSACLPASVYRVEPDPSKVVAVQIRPVEDPSCVVGGMLPGMVPTLAAYDSNKL